MENTDKIENKCDPLNEASGTKHSEKNEDSTVHESEIRSLPSATCEKGGIDMDTSGNKNKLSVNITKEDRNQCDEDSKSVLRKLHMQQQKLSPPDRLQTGPPMKKDHETSETDLAHTFLYNNEIPAAKEREESEIEPLIPSMTNVKVNLEKSVPEMKVKCDSLNEPGGTDHTEKNDDIKKLESEFESVLSATYEKVTMDIECPLWTFRQIIKTWKITQTKDNSNIVTMKNMPIYKAETPMVSFFRLGSLSVSKSQLMNTLINDRHSTFFHRNCPGSTKSHHLMDGVAEIAWYCPAGKPNDNFTDCTAFCNLHGDALLIEKQRDILTEKSSVNVVLLPTLEKGDKSWAVISDLLKSPKPLICLITDNDCGAVQMKEGKYRIGLKDRSQADVSENLKRIIREILSGPHQSFQLETMADVSEIRVDEDDKVCQKGKSAALNIVNLLQGMDVSKIKDQFLPCQGELWHKWCRINKELYHLKGNIEEEKCKKEKELEKIRQDQCTASCSELMKLFNENLSSLPTTEKQYFLKWTQILIDALSTDDLSSILQYYDEKWSEVLDLKKKHDKSDLLKFKQSELEEISNKLQSATFGLEHIFREMGQIYEAHKALNQTDWSKYPELAAELMISGHPMELMDGDAGHVPLTWISSLLDEVIRKLGDQRVFVLSVLGVQSSGKSTMLNAMFGLQFAVSAGRCTKGAFMQLVKVSEEMKKDFQFDYVLVVDTEGLRALELAGNTTLHHDNELATFVVGLGNMTLINIFGENPADMQDVLQIVVQAFMRMKKVKLSPSCVFVHQNVTDIAAAEKNMDGKRRLQEKLDQMTKLAAKEEVCGAECFSDVIAFDVQKDVKYFAQLWEGSPPMAPPNPGYSESIQDLKNFILSKASQSAGMTLSHFKTKIQDLWNALMNEHFVFSFKNTLEIAVYRKLEVQYGNWTWNLRSNMLTIENQLHTRVENGDIDKVEVSFLNKEMSKTYEEIRNNLTTYFEDKREKETLVQWRGRFEQKIKEFHDELVKGAKRKLEEVLQQKKVCKKLDAQKTEFERNLLQKSKELAHQLKDKVKDEEELEKQFKSVWSHWVNELTADTKPIEDIKLEEDQFNVLKELGIEWTYVSESRSSRRYRNISSIGDYSDYVSFTKHQVHCDTSQQSQIKSLAKQYYAQLKKYMTSLQHEDQQLIRSLTENVEAQCINAIKSKPVATRGYSPTYLLEMAKSVKKEVTEFDSKWKYSLKKEFTVDLLLYVFHRADSWLSESHKKYKMNNDAVTYLESKKTQYYNIFRSFCKGSSSAVVFAELICEKLKVSIVKAACNMAAIDLAGEMRSNFPAFNGNRLNLEKHVLKSLAEKKDFDGFITYIHHPRKHVETFIKEEVNKYIFTDHKDKALNILKKNVEDMCKLVSQALFTATDKVKTNGGDIDMWLQQFSSLLKNDLTFETICSQNFSDINNFDFFKEEIEKGLKISNIPPGHEEFREKPHKILIDQLSNCCWSINSERKCFALLVHCRPAGPSDMDVSGNKEKRLMMLDYRARYIPVKQSRAEMSQSETDPVLEISDTEDNGFDALFSSSVDSDQSKQTHVHPMDVQMAVYHCSDSFLKQNMVTKLSQCQYALPLLVPDPVTMDIECPLWTFRQIIKTWKITQTKDNSNFVTMKNMPICKAETPMVSFFRLGSLSVSKSQLMNTLINDRHSTFFHRNCPGSTKSHHLMDGVAEIAWYCPAGKPNDAFTNCTAFCNLHGDALLIEKQRDILTEKSSVNVVLLPTLEKGDKSWAVISDLLKSPKPLICLITDNDCGAVQMKEGKYRIGLKDRSQADVSENLKRIIGEILSGPHQTFQLETMADVSGIRVDEDDKVCQKGKSAALNIVNLLQEMDVSKIKDQFLPCQCELWHKWCRINKELYHLKGNIEEEKCKKQQELMKIRQKQCTASCSELMKLFIENLSLLPTTEKQYFLKWTQILIDALSTDDLSSIVQRYDEKWTEVLDLKKKHDKSDLLKFKQSELEEMSNKLQSATFGLEHIFREMGQIYEAHKALNQTDWSKYPELAAELMISGHPMELMDGDAGHVPLTWISSLLDEVIRKLGDQRVFVLSVLGVQSSGKSTMLNAMFGLQFAVSGGRCTKGAFMQLVKVSEEMKEDFQFDYVLVVDTEGLRALELAGNTSLHHDNELATFVVGLGNMTLINIFGENPADMQDVLQIVVQAFMRMKKVKLSPSCVFVHQNVTDIAAAEKNMDGKRRLQEKLDQMTQLAAKEEVCDAECFSDVIAFDVQKDVKYFAQLWEGSPPMAPPNPGYSESIQDLKNFILSKASQSAGMTLSHFKTKIQDLWNALMNEHFVFSFKNTLEIAVYRQPEVQYRNWTWNLRSNMLNIEKQLNTRVAHGDIDNVEFSFLLEEISKTCETIRNNMTTYFEDNRDKEMLVQWRGRFEQKIKEFHDELVKGAKTKLDEVLQQKKSYKKLDAQKTKFEKKLLQKSKKLAHQLKDNVKDEEELEKQFKSVWSHWVNELTADTKPIEDINLEEDQFNVLKELELICGRLKDSTVEAVCNQTAIDLAGEMRCNFPAFNGNRLNLEKHVLKSLAEKEDFNGFITYIHHPRNHVETFIKEELMVSHEQKIVDRQQLNEAIGLLSNILNSPTAVTAMSEMLEQNRQTSIRETSDADAADGEEPGTSLNVIQVM
ncbi:hypothetical protein Q8A73_016615 [Channa argus]|nr:hypothetical protein Q8A73_016615 [Channa argus]